MKYFKDAAGQVHGFDNEIEIYSTLIDDAIESGWEDISAIWPPAESLEQTKARLSATLTSAINDQAKEWGYDDIVSAASYISSTNAAYASDALTLISWRDDVWAWATNALSTVTPGETAGGFLANLPAAPVKH